MHKRSLRRHYVSGNNTTIGEIQKLIEQAVVRAMNKWMAVYLIGLVIGLAIGSVL